MILKMNTELRTSWMIYWKRQEESYYKMMMKTKILLFLNLIWERINLMTVVLSCKFKLCRIWELNQRRHHSICIRNHNILLNLWSMHSLIYKFQFLTNNLHLFMTNNKTTLTCILLNQFTQDICTLLLLTITNNNQWEHLLNKCPSFTPIKWCLRTTCQDSKILKW